MATTIDSLELEVQSQSTQAVSGIDALSASLSKLKAATKGGVGLTSVTNQLKNLNAALSSTNSSDIAKLDALASSLSKLQGLGQLKISSSIANQIRNIGSAASSLNGINLTGVSTLATALAPLSNLGRATGLGSFIRQLQQLPQLANTLNQINWQTFTTQLRQLSNALAPLANQLNNIGTAFAMLPANMRRLITATNSLTQANNLAGMSYANLWAKARMAYNVIRNGARAIASWVTQSNKYVEDLNLFTASMGEYAQEAQKYAEMVGEVMGIDPGEWMRNQGVFNTIIKGFGVAGDKAYIMSKNLTQLGYDISSFFNISFEDAMTKLQSGIAGELEPLRRLGYDLSVARLEEERLRLGIEKKVSAMTQAEKSQLRYYAIMTQVTVAQGDMARTLNAPANQLRVLQAQVTQCARALGNIFIPALNAVLPYAIALAKVIRMVADAIAKLFGFSLPEVDYSGISAGASAAGELADDLGTASKNAKKLKNNLIGIDELNIISPQDDSGKGSGAGAGLGGSDLGIDLPEYDFLGDLVNSKVDKIVEDIIAKLKEMLPWITAIGAGFAAWTIAKGLVKGLETLSKLLKGFKGGVISFGTVGLLGFLSDMNEFRKFFEDFQKNGATFWNVGGMISEFVGMIGDALIMLGSLKLGGALKVLQGIGELVIACKDIADNGVNWENARMAIRGLTNIAIGIGVFMGNAQGLALAGVALTIQGLLNVIDEVKNIIEAVKTGDWSGVDWVNLVIGALEVIGGLVVAISAFKKIKAAADIANAGTELAEVASTTATVSTATESLNTTVGSGGLTTKLMELVKNLALGIVIIAEVAAAALLFVGAIILLGMELEQVGIAWEPVIANGQTVAIALGLGTVVIAAVGVATALLGSVGTSLAMNIALGIAILAELGVAAGLFIVEIWAIGKGLDEIGKAWQPVLDNGETIATAIGLGTALLVAIGVVTAALGMATVASAGLLPLAIGLGTAILLEMGAATLLFIAEIWAVGKGLDEVGKAWQPVLKNGKTIETGIATGTALLIAIGVVTAALGVATVASAGLLPLAIGLGTALLVELAAAFIVFTESLVAVADELSNNLSPALIRLNAKLPTLSTNMSNFVDFMTEFAEYVVAYTKVNAIASLSATIDTIIGWFTQDPVQKLANDVDKMYTQTSDLNDKLNLAVPELQEARDLLKKYQTFLQEIESLTQSNPDLSKGTFANMKEVGQKIVTGFVDGIKSKSGDFKNAGKDLVDGFKSSVETSSTQTKSSVTTWATNLKNWFTGSGYGAINKTTWQTYGRDIVTGFSTGVSTSYTSSKSSITTWATNVKQWFTGSGYGAVNKTTWEKYARDIITGFNSGIVANYSTSKSGVTTWANDIKKWFTDKSYGGVCKSTWEGYGKDIVTGFNSGITNNYSSSESEIKKWGKNTVSWFEKPFGDNTTITSKFKQIGKDVVQGFIDGIDSKLESARKKVKELADLAKQAAESSLKIGSPSKVFAEIGRFMVQGFNVGIDSEMGNTFRTMGKWLDGVNNFQPTLAFAVDTSALSYYDTRDWSRQANAEVTSRYAVETDSFSEGMETFYREYVEPSVRRMVTGIEKQADKQEQTIVQVGNRVVTDAVVTQQKANGYVFTK